MRVTEIPHNLELGKPADDYFRTEGLHASDLYGAYYKAYDPKRYDKRDKDGNPQPMDMAKIEFGLSFEQELEVWLALMMDAVRRRMAGRLLGDRPGEFTHHHARCKTPAGKWCKRNCVIFSPDYLFEEPAEMVLGEFKLSWYSSNEAPFNEKFDKWITQMKLYCYWLGVRKARLYVFFVNDNYKPPTPRIRCWEIVFTQRELDDEHNVIMRHALKKGLVEA